MADNYRQTSFVIPKLSEKEATWLAAELARREAEYAADEVQFRNDGDGASGWGHHLWISSSEWVDVDAVASLLRAFLTEFRPNDALDFSYADTCSKPRVDEFSGGAVFVTAKGVRTFHADAWLDTQRTRFRAQSKSSKRRAPKRRR